MTLHHYLPASFIARFSADSITEPARDRILVVGDKKKKRWFKAPASKVGAVRNLYAIVEYFNHPDEIDQTWAEYEQKLPSAIEDLLQRNVEAETWARVLVPFVACMLVRGPDFIEKFDQRFPPNRPEIVNELLSNDNANKARLMELQRLLGFVATADWIVLRAHGNEMLITNDLGYSPFVHPIYKHRGMAIPLSHTVVLAVIPNTANHTVLVDKANKWTPIIKYLDLPPDNHLGLNNAVAQNALRFIFGADEAVVQKYLRAPTMSSTSLEPGELGFPGGRFSRAHEFTWHRMVSALNKPPSDVKGWDFEINMEYIASGWHSGIVFPMNLVEFPPALKRVNDTIQTRFYDPEPYYVLSHLLMMEKTGQYEVVIEEATNYLFKNSPPSKIKARILGVRGNSFAEISRFVESRRDFKYAISLDPSNVNLLNDFGYVLLKSGNPHEAYRVLTKAVKRDANNGIAYSNRAVAQWQSGRHNRALIDINIALGLLPDGVEKASALLNGGKILKELGKDEQANLDLDQAKILFEKYQTKNNTK